MSATELLDSARLLGQLGDLQRMVEVCQQCVNENRNSIPTIQSVGLLLLQFGHLGNARKCFEYVARATPDDLAANLHLANIRFEYGDIGGFKADISTLLLRYPGHPILQRNLLMGLEYDPLVSAQERIEATISWGKSITRKAYARTTFALPLKGRPLRIGYVSADFCQHTVGLFLRGILEHHDRNQIKAYCYSNSSHTDGMTRRFMAISEWRDISAKTDEEMATQIREDAIDVLIDLSGHSARSRLSMFALKPAPLQVSWLGYFATTGLPTMDAVLLDPGYDFPGIESQFSERIVNLPNTRFCFQPIPDTPSITPDPPSTTKGFVTFGCFNNTAKLNAGVLTLWAEILEAVPESRLILKWRTFADQDLKQQITHQFTSKGIDSDRIEFRTASFHADMLKEYNDIDIALDPFPFSGGMTSCETLWMGVPIITLPEDRMVSRQTAAILRVIGITETIASTKAEYVSMAAKLAKDEEKRKLFRKTIRAKMSVSPLMRVDQLTRDLESTLSTLYAECVEKQKASSKR